MGDRLERPEWLEDAAPVYRHGPSIPMPASARDELERLAGTRRVVHGPADERYAAPDDARPLPLPRFPDWLLPEQREAAEAAMRETFERRLEVWRIGSRPHREAVWTVRNEPLDRDR